MFILLLLLFLKYIKGNAIPAYIFSGNFLFYSQFAVKMAKNSSWPVTSLWSRGPLKDLKDFKLILNESNVFQWSSRISLVPFKTFRGPLFPKPVTGQELFFWHFLQQTRSTHFFPAYPFIRVSPCIIPIHLLFIFHYLFST